MIPLVAELRARVGAEYAGAVHFGATSQDIVDTGAMLVSKRALAPILTDAHAAVTAAAHLAFSHRSTPIAGRTLLQQALPTSFGLVAAGWAGRDRARRLRTRARAETSYWRCRWADPSASRPPQIAARVAATLGLAEPVLPWHTDRTRVAQLAAALGALAGAGARSRAT